MNALAIGLNDFHSTGDLHDVTNNYFTDAMIRHQCRVYARTIFEMSCSDLRIISFL